MSSRGGPDCTLRLHLGAQFLHLAPRGGDSPPCPL